MTLLEICKWIRVTPLSVRIRESTLMMLVRGYPLFTSEAMKCYVNDGFKFTIVALVPAVLFQYTLFRLVTRQVDAQRSRPLGAVAAALSLALWLGVGTGGRAIEFV